MGLVYPAGQMPLRGRSRSRKGDHPYRDRPQDTRIELLSPATNTVRFKGSYLLVPRASADG